ncbi:hypothetical protein [Embleya sp. AB8]|uniref:hypothetical protein n=1 Tax=Embleya sp. AB8 TaxID=3156304 RepID=UPI003C722746
MLPIHNRPGFVEELSETEHTELFGEVDALIAEPTGSGELLGGEALADPAQTRTVRGHLLEPAGDRDAAREAYRAAARRTTGTPERRYLEIRAARVAGGAPGRGEA